MPNWVRNIVTFDCSDKMFQMIVDHMRGDDGAVDFNKIVPMPADLAIESGSSGNRGYAAYAACQEKLKNAETPEKKQAIVDEAKSGLSEREWDLGKRYYDNERDYGVATWYDWCNQYWGTKWNACEATVGDRRFEFDTAWDGVPDLIRKLSGAFPTVHIMYQYADEDIGRNLSEYEFEDGVELSYWEPTTEKEAYEFAAEVWDIDLAESGYILNETGDGYEWHDPDNEEVK